MSFTDGKPRIATEKDITAKWGGKKPGESFRCYLCGYKFKVGDYWRFVYTNHISNAGGNPLVCEQCDGEDVKVKWKQHYQNWEEIRCGKFWWFATRNY